MADDTAEEPASAHRWLRQPLREAFPARPHDEGFDRALAHLVRQRRLRALPAIAGNVAFYGIVILVGGWLVAQAVDRDIPVITKVNIVSRDVAAGGTLAMRVEPVWQRLCESKLTFDVFDGEDARKTIELDWRQPMVARTGPDKPFIRTIRIPPDAVPGHARLRIERQFRCPRNIFHQRWPITEVSPDMPFVITPSGQPSKAAGQ